MELLKSFPTMPQDIFTENPVVMGRPRSTARLPGHNAHERNFNAASNELWEAWVIKLPGVKKKKERKILILDVSGNLTKAFSDLVWLM